MKSILIYFFIFMTPIIPVFGQTKEQVNDALDQMKASGAFSSEQIEAARKQMMKMDEKDYQNIVDQAKIKAADPKIQNEVKELFNKTKNELKEK